jgi:hypothetical protein
MKTARSARGNHRRAVTAKRGRAMRHAWMMFQPDLNLPWRCVIIVGPPVAR